MVQTIEAIKLLIDDPDIQARVQVMMLLDEEVVEHATAAKFDGLIAHRAGPAAGSKAVRDAVVEEHFEKLFTCHLRLPTLNADEVEELAERYARQDLAMASEEANRREQEVLAAKLRAKQAEIEGLSQPRNNTSLMKD